MVDKSSFKPDTRYTITLRKADTTVSPADIYVFRAYDKFLVARLAGADGLLRRIDYAQIERVVRLMEVPANARYQVPAALLDEKSWMSRNVMQHYASSPSKGK